MAVADGMQRRAKDSAVTSRDVHEAADSQASGECEVSRYCLEKDLLDRILAAWMLIPALPLMVILVVLVRMTSKGPGIYRQTRMGRGGRIFTMYKIRTMRSDAETATGAVWCIPGDARITRLGRWLRRLHLDELPQLFNVLRGEMSLVGPRPERPEFVEVLARKIPGYRHRLAVAPGITGLAQANLPPDTDLDSVRRKLVLDLEYVRTANLWLDLRILLFTSTRLVAVPNRFTLPCLGLKRKVVLPTADLNPSIQSQQTPDALVNGHVNGSVVGNINGNGSGHLNGHSRPIANGNGHLHANGHPLTEDAKSVEDGAEPEEPGPAAGL